MSEINTNSFDDRTKLLLNEKFTKLANLKIAICGIGGVGSIIPNAMLRSGIKNFVIIDFDTVDISNLNRQICYTEKDVGKKKVFAMEEFLRTIRNDFQIEKYDCLIDESFDFSIFNDCDYVFDCIDDIKAKIQLIKYCEQKKIKIISSLGMGNRIDPSLVKITTLDKTSYDPVAKILRHDLKKEGIDTSKIRVSFSSEQPIIKSKVISSMVFVPNASGLCMASYALDELINM